MPLIIPFLESNRIKFSVNIKFFNIDYAIYFSVLEHIYSSDSLTLSEAITYFISPSFSKPIQDYSYIGDHQAAH
jgi:hypothetical protein